mmetsp:Transcript_6688/g.7285  ORF Transcript_6688/g.7285 Transcript_6688/m.7285 type:complete len:374 (-) Transcript_6688:59-1180(-)
MGQACTRSAPKDAQWKAIEDQLKKERKHNRNKIKLLVLGTSASGKSTVVKQVRMRYGAEFSPFEKENFKTIIQVNIFLGTKLLVEKAEKLNIKIARKNKKAGRLICDSNLFAPGEVKPLLEACKQLWTDTGIRKAYSNNEKEVMIAHYKHWMDDVINPLMNDKDWVPSDDDIVYCRQRTTGIVETGFHHKKFDWLLVDVGGQKTERRKWIHCFEGMNSVLYVAAADAWDSPSQDSVGLTKMQESLQVWREVVHSPYFENTSIILFLNKIDLVESKLQNCKLADTFPDYQGNSTDDALQYIEDKYLALVDDRERDISNIYVHYTCAVDKEQIRVVFEIVMESIFRDRLRHAGLVGDFSVPSTRSMRTASTGATF